MSDKQYEGSFFDHFRTIYDPRQDEKVKHKLIDIWMDARKEWTKMKGIDMVIRKVQIDDKKTRNDMPSGA